jgi:hypothetical protein
VDGGGVGQVECDCDREAGREVRGQRAESDRPGERKPSAEPDDRCRGEAPDRPARRLDDQGAAECDQAAGALRVDELLRRRYDRDHAPCDGRDNREAARAHRAIVARIANRVEARDDRRLHHRYRSRRSTDGPAPRSLCRREQRGDARHRRPALGNTATARCERISTVRFVR